MQEPFLGNSAEDLSEVKITADEVKMTLPRQEAHEHRTNTKRYSLESSIMQHCGKDHLKLFGFGD